MSSSPVKTPLPDLRRRLSLSYIVRVTKSITRSYFNYSKHPLSPMPQPTYNGFRCSFRHSLSNDLRHGDLTHKRGTHKLVSVHVFACRHHDSHPYDSRQVKARRDSVDFCTHSLSTKFDRTTNHNRVPIPHSSPSGGRLLSCIYHDTHSHSSIVLSRNRGLLLNSS